MNYFICPGAQKAGTTSLYNLLCQHPQINLSSKKETKYFINYNKVNIDEYLSKFFKSIKSDLTGEIDPDYMFDSEVPEKIFAVFSNELKLVFMIRNPIDRAYSHYWMSYRRGFEQESFETAFEKETTRLANRHHKAYWHQSYFARGFYTNQIVPYLERFGEKNCLFVNFDDFICDRIGTIRIILKFLKVDERYDFKDPYIKSNKAGLSRSSLLRMLHGRPPKFLKFFKILIPNRKFRWGVIYPIMEKLNKSKVRPPAMKDETRAMLTEYYADELGLLSQTTKIDTNKWLVI